MICPARAISIAIVRCGIQHRLTWQTRRLEMNILDTIMNAGNGAAVRQIGSQVGRDECDRDGARSPHAAQNGTSLITVMW